MIEDLLPYILVHAVTAMYLLMIACYLILSKRSAFVMDVEPSLRIRKVTGWNMVLWAVAFILPCHKFFTIGTPTEVFMNNLCIMIDMLVIPGIIYLLSSLVQAKTILDITSKYITIPAALLIIAYLITGEQAIILISVIYWTIVTVCLSIYFVKIERAYKRRLNNQFSNIENKELNWTRTMVVLFVIYFFVYVLANTMSAEWLLYCSYIFCITIWSYTVWHVEQQELLLDFWAGAIENADYKALDAEEILAMEKEANDNLSWIGERLDTLCVESGLYLEPSLSLDSLAREMATNRTYISQYLASKGTTYYNYINSLRIDYAVKLIKNSLETNAPIVLNELAFKCGYKTDNTFRRAFSEYTGCLPSQYIAKSREQRMSRPVASTATALLILLVSVLSLLPFNADAQVRRISHSRVHSFHFRLDKDEVDTTYLDNAQIFKNMRYVIDSIGIRHIDSITVYVQSSPEAPAWYNDDLSRRRAVNTSRYFNKHFADAYHLMRIRPDGESWGKLRDFIVNDTALSVSTSAKALKIIDSVRDRDQREETLKREMPEFYKYIYDKFYPYLRHTLVTTIWTTELWPEGSNGPGGPGAGTGTGTGTGPGTGTGTGVGPGYPPYPPYPPVVNDTIFRRTYVNDTIFIGKKPWTHNDSIMRHPILALKTNLLFDVVTFLNGEIEVPIGSRWSIMAEVTWPWWLEKKHNKWCAEMGLVGIEARFWMPKWKYHSSYKQWKESKRAPLKGFFLGAYAYSGYFDFQPYRKRGWQGEFVSAGLSLGYSTRLSNHWRMEFSTAIGAIQYKHRRYHVHSDDEPNDYEHHPQWNSGDQHLWQDQAEKKAFWLGPTKAKISISWLMFRKCKTSKYKKK